MTLYNEDWIAFNDKIFLMCYIFCLILILFIIVFVIFRIKTQMVISIKQIVHK